MTIASVLVQPQRITRVSADAYVVGPGVVLKFRRHTGRSGRSRSKKPSTLASSSSAKCGTGPCTSALTLPSLRSA